MAQEPLKEVEAALQQAEARRCAALVARDMPELEALMHPDLVHIHATGSMENLQQFLHGVRERLRFLTCERLDYRIRLAGTDTALASGRAKQRVRVEASGQELEMEIVTTQVWVREGGAWRVLHFQATHRK